MLLFLFISDIMLKLFKHFLFVSTTRKQLQLNNHRIKQYLTFASNIAHTDYMIMLDMKNAYNRAGISKAPNYTLSNIIMMLICITVDKYLTSCMLFFAMIMQLQFCLSDKPPAGCVACQQESHPQVDRKGTMSWLGGSAGLDTVHLEPSLVVLCHM